MKFLSRTLVLLAVMIGLTRSAYADVLPQPATAKEDPTIDVRGGDSIVESIDMSPQATRFWRNLRETARTTMRRSHLSSRSIETIVGRCNARCSSVIQICRCSANPCG
ncbi:hypothetical protein [Ralstonia solanacearum]|uniref:hypothetical protein n=1 Tax=Ralstonia solanacearum TaxID=305 RepID=UPI0018D0E242|nr:hypothetical protein [Ralstonia solanacearum]